MRRDVKSLVMAFALPLLGTLACSKQLPPPGELVVAVSTDVSIPKDVDTIRMQVISNGRSLYDTSFPVFPGSDGVKIPATLGILAGPDPTALVLVRAIAIGHRKALILREATVQVPTDRTALLQFPLQWLSQGSAEDKAPNGPSTSDPTIDDIVEKNCKENETEISGTCMSDSVDATTLPTYDSGLVFGGGSADGGGQCFDTVGCFSTAKTVALDMSDCSLDVPEKASVSKLNVAFTPEGGAGICETGGTKKCFVPLDDDPNGGWTEKDGKLMMPPGLCTEIRAGMKATVVLSTSCDSKKAELPTCGPWSAISSEGSDAGTVATGGGNGSAGGPPTFDASAAGKDSSIGGAGASACAALAACCGSLPTDALAACEETADLQDESACAEELSSFGTECQTGGTGTHPLPDSGSPTPTCAGRVPDESSPVGVFSGGSGIVSNDSARSVDLSTLVDGYATSRTVAEETCDAGMQYMLELTLTSYPGACGYFANDLASIGAGVAVIDVYSPTPFAKGSYAQGLVHAAASGIPAGTPAGACSASSMSVGGPVCSGEMALTITSIDAKSVSGSFNFDAGSGTVSGTFTVPFCTAKDLPLCCVESAERADSGLPPPPRDAGARPDGGDAAAERCPATSPDAGAPCILPPGMQCPFGPETCSCTGSGWECAAP